VNNPETEISDNSVQLPSNTVSAKKSYYASAFALLSILLIGIGIAFMGGYKAANQASNDYLWKSTNCFDSQTDSFKSDQNYDPSTNSYVGDSTDGTTITGETYDECISALSSLALDRSVKQKHGDTGRELFIAGLLGLLVTFFAHAKSKKAKKNAVDVQNFSISEQVEARLSRLQDLLDNGQISQSEYAEARLKVISES